MKHTQWLLAFLLALFAVYLAREPVLIGEEDFYRHTAVEAKVKTIILENYYRSVSKEELHEGAMKGMFSILDPYSAYIPPKKVKEFDLDTTGQFGGLGIIIEIREGILTVVTPIQGSPAQKAGLLAGDKILKIRYQKKGKWLERSGEFDNLEEAREVLTGPPGTQVILTVLHPDGRKEEIPVTRAIITVRSVKAVRLLDKKHKIGYIRISAFQNATLKEVVQALRKLREKGVTSLILDLRFNPGGILQEAIHVADQFLEEGVIVQTRGRREDQKREFFATRGGEGLFLRQIVVLINRGSASAAEIVAGALQDHKRAVLVGENSWGKGSVQSIYEIPEGRDEEGHLIKSKIKLTTALYYTPNGRSIHRQKGEEKGGLVPDVEVKLTPKEEALLFRKQNEEDIEVEKRKAAGLSTLEYQPLDRKKWKEKIRTQMAILPGASWADWIESQEEDKLFEDRQLKKALEILRNPKWYRQLIQRREKSS